MLITYEKLFRTFSIQFKRLMQETESNENNETFAIFRFFFTFFQTIKFLYRHFFYLLKVCFNSRVIRHWIGSILESDCEFRIQISVETKNHIDIILHKPFINVEGARFANVPCRLQTMTWFLMTWVLGNLIRTMTRGGKCKCPRCCSSLMHVLP